MSDDLIYRIFVELAVLEKKRNVDGTWVSEDSTDVGRLLKRAYRIVTRATSSEDDDKPEASSKLNAGP